MNTRTYRLRLNPVSTFSGKIHIENIKESPSRLDAVKKLCESMNAKVEGFYLTLGRYDIVLIVDAPDAETVAKIVLAITSKGAVRTETLFAFPEKDYRRIISELP